MCEQRMMVQPAPRAPLKVIEPAFLFELLVRREGCEVRPLRNRGELRIRRVARRDH